MNTKNLKAYAPKARRQFIDAVKKRAAHLGIYQHKVEPLQFEGGAALIEGRVFSRKQGEQRQQLEKRVASKGYEFFLREMAYTWFNRFAALRYMEIHEYLDHGFRVLSHPTNPDSLPEVLGHASDVADSLELDKSHIIELQLAGDKEEELYRELLLGQCHYLSKIMPFMFEQLDDATELLLPDNLTKTDSILKDLVNDIPEEDWSQIEIIGWLYQFYISEHKDAVMGKVVKSEDIPAATQLFTPNWIVKYLVQNSLGRQWLATYPESELKGKMECYIEPSEQSPEVIEQLKAITPSSIDPEQIKVLDPAAGSGHILVEVYEVLREIYLERGYRLREIPELILTKNIYGLDIDDRAAQLAGFALMMKAREDDRRIFQRVQDGEVVLNVYSLQSTEGLDVPKLWSALDLEDKHQTGSTGGLFDDFDQRGTFEHQADDEVSEVAIPAQAGIYSKYYQLLNYLKTAFLQAKTLGSLIQIDNLQLVDLLALKELLETKQKGTDPASKQASLELIPIVKQAITLAYLYDAVVANPPYMGVKGMNAELKDFANDKFPKSKYDLYAMIKEKAFNMIVDNGYNAMIVMESWMFLSTYQFFRANLIEDRTIVDLVHMPYVGKGRTPLGINFGTSASIIHKKHFAGFKGHFSCIQFDEINKQGVPLTFPCNNKRRKQIVIDNFKLIPGKSIGYWLDKKLLNTFSDTLLKEQFTSGGRLKTHNDEKHVRYTWEVRADDVDISWKQLAHGGDFKRWYGNKLRVVRWTDSSKKEYASHGGLHNEKYWNKLGVTCSKITSSTNSFRLKDCNQEYSSLAPTILAIDTETSKNQTYRVLAILNSKVTQELLLVINPSLTINVGDLLVLPVFSNAELSIKDITTLIDLAKFDWDTFELSFEFAKSPLVNFGAGLSSIEESFRKVIENWKSIAEKTKRIEECLNKIIIDGCGVAEYFTADVPEKQITLSTNPHYRYGAIAPLEMYVRQLSDVISEFVSYALGCMMGRYSLDREGLVYAHSGNEGFKELVAEGAYQTFPADDDGIIPLASEDWFFDDDATTRFREFVSIVWGAEHLSENLAFVAESLCLHALKLKRGEGAMDTIRRYFSTQFFKDHCKTYKKRPIYWLFSSGKEKSFECLVYLHRYNEGTLSRMRTEYVTPLMGKYDHQHSSLEQDIFEGSTEQKRLAEKALKDLEKKQAELRTFDGELKHFAEMRITLDLDDGVKVNYGKFGNLLADVKNIHGVAVK
ncbi:MAG: type II restriction/modification system DNA methylase subunit YeeA [Oleiphilaceae bacterium]|jgi:type II restriction/modification system DNA methylase subunit YeeA